MSVDVGHSAAGGQITGFWGGVTFESFVEGGAAERKSSSKVRANS
jgi:hypothetical protein